MKTERDTNDSSLVQMMIDRLILLIVIFTAIFTVKWEDIGINWTNFVFSLITSITFLAIIIWVYMRDHYQPQAMSSQIDSVSKKNTEEYTKF